MQLLVYYISHCMVLAKARYPNIDKLAIEAQAILLSLYDSCVYQSPPKASVSSS